MKHILIILLFVFSHLAFSAVYGTAKIKGKIVSYDKNTVTLSQNGKKIKVSKKSIPSSFKIKGGNEVYALISAEEVIKRLQKKPKKDKEAKKSSAKNKINKK